jgi:hypothetical protein
MNFPHINFKAAIQGTGFRSAQAARQGMALVLSALMVMVPMGQSSAYAQEPLPGVTPLEEQQQAPPDYGQQGPPPNYDQNYDQQGPPANYDQSAPPPSSYGQQGAQGQALAAEQLDQLVAPIALYPDSLVAQVLAASTYPTQIVEANRWLKDQGNVSASEIAARVDEMQWDASVKALTAFPSVLERMDHNLQWTTDLGNAYYNQPQDVMASIQAMRHQAEQAGNLRTTPQQRVAEDNNGDVDIYPANPAVVYVPVYDPWAVWGYPLVAYPGFWYYPPPGIYWGGFLVGFGFGINIGWWGGFGWGWGHWGCGWHNRSVFFNRTTFVTRSTTVFNRGISRPGSPPRALAGTRGSFVNHGFTRTAGGSFVRSGGGGTTGFNRGGGSTSFNRGGATGFNRGGTSSLNRGGTSGFNRGGPSGFNRGGGASGTSQGSFNRGGAANRGSFGGNRPFSGGPTSSMSRPSSGPVSRPSFNGGGGFSGGRSSGGGFSGGRPSGGGPAMGGGGHMSGGGGGGHVGGGGGHSGGGGGGGGGHGR